MFFGECESLCRRANRQVQIAVEESGVKGTKGRPG